MADEKQKILLIPTFHGAVKSDYPYRGVRRIDLISSCPPLGLTLWENLSLPHPALFETVITNTCRSTICYVDQSQLDNASIPFSDPRQKGSRHDRYEGQDQLYFNRARVQTVEQGHRQPSLVRLEKCVVRKSRSTQSCKDPPIDHQVIRCPNRRPRALHEPVCWPFNHLPAHLIVYNCTKHEAVVDCGRENLQGEGFSLWFLLSKPRGDLRRPELRTASTGARDHP
ncbi:uncharacterized protein LOC128093385 [Culex pipiens pallens]|uniref:uncharacterized protein LOC128093385 n=1 Tax=Culex pipiens pallens TaxID=42434 RepID=UPI0022AABA27|nr:uncharacterized protein LOC128093385 [Culex pipiens pallens]